MRMKYGGESGASYGPPRPSTPTPQLSDLEVAVAKVEALQDNEQTLRARLDKLVEHMMGRALSSAPDDAAAAYLECARLVAAALREE